MNSTCDYNISEYGTETIIYNNDINIDSYESSLNKTHFTTLDWGCGIVLNGSGDRDREVNRTILVIDYFNANGDEIRVSHIYIMIYLAMKQTTVLCWCISRGRLLSIKIGSVWTCYWWFICIKMWFQQYK